MEIHVVKPGDTLFSLSMEYDVPMSQIALDNGLEAPNQLVSGQALVIRFPQVTHVVQPGDTLSSIARQYGVSLRALYQNNPILGGRDQIWLGETLVISYRQRPGPSILVNAYAYANISDDLLFSTLPFLSYLTPFTYGFTSSGALVELSDARLISAALSMGTAPLMHLSTLTPEGGFSNELSHLLLNDLQLQNVLIDNLTTTLLQKGYRGLDVDFEYVFSQDAEAYAAFLHRLTNTFNPMGFPVIAALAPKTSATQKGELYEGHNFSAIGAAVNQVLLMTYEWGYTYGPPMAVAPLPNVRQVVEYALTEIPARKIWLGVPNYGYDWPLPFVQGETRATSIQYDNKAQSPWFQYTDESGQNHEVWFEDARSIRAKLALIPEYGLIGAGYWNLMREFPQNWVVLSSLYQIRDIEN